MFLSTFFVCIIDSFNKRYRFTKQFNDHVMFFIVEATFAILGDIFALVETSLTKTKVVVQCHFDLLEIKVTLKVH